MTSAFQCFLGVALAIAGVDRPREAGYDYRGLAKLKNGDLDGAIVELDRAIEHNPSSVTSYGNRGIAKGKKGDLDGAIADFDRAIELDPKSALSYANRGFVKIKKGWSRFAISDLDHAIEIDSQFALPYAFRAIANDSEGRVQTAIQDCERALELDPNNEKHVFYHGILLLQKRDNTGAISAFRHSCEETWSDQAYGCIFLWLTRTINGERDAADREMTDYFSKPTKQGGWTNTIGRFLINKIGETEFLNVAENTGSKDSKERLCEAWYFAAMKRLLSGDKETAGKYFRNCLNTQDRTSAEFLSAQFELGALEAAE